MAKFNFNKVLKQSSDLLKKSADKISETVNSEEFKEGINNAVNKGTEVAGNLAKKSSDAINNFTEGLNKKIEDNDICLAQEVLKVLGYLIIVDGVVDDNEIDKFNEIGKKLDINFESYKEDVLDKVKSLLIYKDKEDYYEIIHDYVSDCLKNCKNDNEILINPKYLIWNMYALAYSDDDYSKYELRLINYVARYFNINPSILLEMENSINIISTIEKEKAILNTSTKPYNVIHERVEELENREQIIFKAISALIED